MRITVTNRQTGKVVFDLDVNDEGNIHELVLEHRGSKFIVDGASYSPGINISALPAAPIVVLPVSRNEIHVKT